MNAEIDSRLKFVICVCQQITFRPKLLSSAKPLIGDKRTWMLDGTVGVRNGPAIVGVIVETKSIPFSFANWNAASSDKTFWST